MLRYKDPHYKYVVLCSHNFADGVDLWGTYRDAPVSTGAHTADLEHSVPVLERRVSHPVSETRQSEAVTLVFRKYLSAAVSGEGGTKSFVFTNSHTTA